jgi:hypothetical protein
MAERVRPVWRALAATQAKEHQSTISAINQGMYAFGKHSGAAGERCGDELRGGN